MVIPHQLCNDILFILIIPIWKQLRRIFLSTHWAAAVRMKWNSTPRPQRLFPLCHIGSCESNEPVWSRGRCKRRWGVDYPLSIVNIAATLNPSYTSYKLFSDAQPQRGPRRGSLSSLNSLMNYFIINASPSHSLTLSLSLSLSLHFSLPFFFSFLLSSITKLVFFYVCTLFVGLPRVYYMA